MLRGICTLALLGIFFTAPALAQKPAAKTQPTAPAIGSVVEKPAPPTLSPGELKATPEMWFYEQYMHQYLDPKMAVRANAEFQANQRQQRLAAMQWFGVSNSRPRACPDPFHGDYSPHWASNNSAYPYSWSGVGPTTLYITRPERATVVTY